MRSDYPIDLWISLGRLPRIRARDRAQLTQNADVFSYHGKEKVMIDELTQVANYMAHEINTNAKGQDCQRMREWNSVSMTTCLSEYQSARWWQQLLGLTVSPQQCQQITLSSRQAALVTWTINVMQNGVWDHKPKIRAKFTSRINNSGAWHRYSDKDYYYDTWSNIHYGYIGAAAGFSASMLLDGAGLEQIGSTLLRGRLPVGSPDVKGLRKFDDKSDRLSITIGLDLWREYPNHLPSSTLLKRVLQTQGLETRPAATALHE